MHECHLSRSTAFPARLHVRPAKKQISRRIHFPSEDDLNPYIRIEYPVKTNQTAWVGLSSLGTQTISLEMLARRTLVAHLYTNFTQFDCLKEKLHTSIKSRTGICRIYFPLRRLKRLTVLATFATF